MGVDSLEVARKSKLETGTHSNRPELIGNKGKVKALRATRETTRSLEPKPRTHMEGNTLRHLVSLSGEHFAKTRQERYHQVRSLRPQPPVKKTSQIHIGKNKYCTIISRKRFGLYAQTMYWHARHKTKQSSCAQGTQDIRVWGTP